MEIQWEICYSEISTKDTQVNCQRMGYRLIYISTLPNVLHGSHISPVRRGIRVFPITGSIIGQDITSFITSVLRLLFGHDLCPKLSGHWNNVHTHTKDERFLKSGRHIEIESDQLLFGQI